MRWDILEGWERPWGWVLIKFIVKTLNKRIYFIDIKVYKKRREKKVEMWWT
jgi:hypothetical protein